MRLGVTVVVLVGLSGAQWWVLQSVAWSGMIVSYSAKSGILKGVEQTFDGDHPCPMCKAIKKVRESESRSTDALAPIQRSVELLGVLASTEIFLTRATFPSPTVIPLQAEARDFAPPVPPPRILPA